MQVLSMTEVDQVSGALTPAEGAGLVLTLALAAPLGFAMGFGIAVAAGLVYISTM